MLFRSEGYVLPNAVIFKKIEETLAIGGTGVLMQGGHHPDLDIAYYESLFSSIKARYKVHLHALSPSEVQHISRRSKLTLWETLSRLRDAGLDSIPGGGGEILDPNNGKVYKVRLKPADGGKKLDVRGYIGAPLLGRTQTWIRVE